MGRLADADRMKISADKQLGFARRYFERILEKMGLGEYQIEGQTIDELNRSLERINEAIKDHQSFGTLKLKLSADLRIIITQSRAEYHFEVGILPILLERKQAIQNRIFILSNDNYDREETPMPGIPSTLLQEIRQTLMLCDEFSSQRQLKAIFAEQRLKTFQSGLPEADSTGGRVDLTISYLSGKRLSSGENGLVVLLEVLIGRKDQADELHSKLERLKGKLTVVLSGKMEAQMNLDNRGDSLNILVTGGRDINNQACAIAAAIGSLAVESGHKLLTGGATGTDERAAKGAYDYLIEMGKDPKESILTYRPEQSPKPHFEYGQVIIAGKKHYQRRGNLVQDCDVIIIISGDEGTDHIFELARQQNKPILPIGQTEGKAKEKWDAIAINLDSFYAGRVSKLDFRQLYSGSNAPEIIAQWAIRLAERIARIETKGSRVNNTESQSVEEQLQEEVESLKRQLKQLKHSLLRVQERRASFVDPRNAPPDLEENESLLKNRIADVEHRLLDLIG